MRKRRGFTLVEIMIVVAIIALLAAIAIPNLLTARRTANEAAAKASLRTLSTAAETYATAHAGVYPASLTELTEFVASAGNYCPDKLVQGYSFTCTYTSGGYSFVGTPASSATGTITYTASTGGVLTPL